jgi:Raf kinase inhibitor-like YbhB/YbcL family protein
MKRLALLVLLALLLTSVTSCGDAAAPLASPEPSEEPLQPPADAPPADQTEPAAAAETAAPEETEAPEAEEPPPPPAFSLSSGAFGEGEEIPVLYSCQGDNLSPPLEWVGVPEGTQSLVLLVDDPDSQPPGWVHWVIYNMPPTTTALPEGFPPDATLADGTLQGRNDFYPYGAGTFPGGAQINLIGYDGPCPGGTHRYVFTLYALDTLLELAAEATMAEVLDAMQGHILGQVSLTGVYTPQ